MSGEEDDGAELLKLARIRRGSGGLESNSGRVDEIGVQCQWQSSERAQGVQRQVVRSFRRTPLAYQIITANLDVFARLFGLSMVMATAAALLRGALAEGMRRLDRLMPAGRAAIDHAAEDRYEGRPEASPEDDEDA